MCTYMAVSLACPMPKQDWKIDCGGHELCRGSLAVASDSFGRVLLIDVVSLTVIRIWKSYRDAQFGWVMCSRQQTMPQQPHSIEDNQLQSQSQTGKRRRAESESANEVLDSNNELDNSAYLHLVLYAPRRQALELWQMRHGHRIVTVQVPSACRLFQRATAFGLDPDRSDQAGSGFSTPADSQCMILDTSTGQCMDVLAALHQQFQRTVYM